MLRESGLVYNRQNVLGKTKNSGITQRFPLALIPAF